MNAYAVTWREASRNRFRREEVRAHMMDVHMGVLVFTETGKGTVKAFKEWVRVDRLN